MPENLPIQPTVYDIATGNPVPIPEAKIPQAIASGKYAFAKGAQIPVVHPDTGEIGTIPAESAHEAFKSGYTLQPLESQRYDALQDQYGGPLGQLESGAAGAARAASFGLSDVALTKSGLVKPSTLKALEEANPKASLAGEAAGIVVPALFGEEGGLLNAAGKGIEGASAIGKAVEKGASKFLPEATSVAGDVLKNAAAKGAGFGTEGALYGLGQSISENALGDHDLISEHTLSNIGMSAALAGGLGAAFGAGASLLGKDASSGAEKLAAMNMAESALPGSAEDLMSKTGLPAAEKNSFIEGLTKQKPNAPEIIKAGEEIGAPVIPGQTSASDYVQSMSSALSQSPTIPGVQLQQTIDRGFDAVKNVIKETLGAEESLTPFQAGGKIKDQISDVVDKMYAPIKKAYSDLEIAGKSISLPDEARIKLYDRLIEKGQNFGSVGSKGGKIISEYAEKALSQNTSAQLDELMSEIGAEQRSAFRAGDTHTSKALGLVNDELHDFQVKQMIKQAKEVAGPEGEDIANELIKKIKDTDASYKEFKETLNDLASEGRLGKKLKTHGAVESVLDSIPNEKIVEKMFDPKNAAGLKTLQEKFPDVFKTLVDHRKSEILAKSMKGGAPEVGKVLREIDKLSPEIKELMFSKEELSKLNASKTWIEALPKNVGPSGTPKGQAFMDALKNPISSILANAKDYGIKHLLRFSSPQEANKTMLLINAEKQSIRGAEKIKAGIDDILEKSKKPIRPSVIYGASKIASVDDFKEKKKQIAEMANNPMVLHDKIASNTESVFEHAPNLAGSLQRSMINGVSFLNSKFEPHPPAGPFMKEPDPSSAEISKFNRYYSVVENPISVLHQIKDGTLSNEAIETMQAVYPKLYGQMKSAIFNQISEMDHPEELPYRTKMVLSKFLGEPIHPSQSAQNIASAQMIYSQIPQQQALKQPKSSQTGMKELKVANRFGLRPNDEV